MKRLLTLLICICPFIINGQVVTTVAGNGTYSYSGDGGAATSASFLSLNDVAFDTAGNLYILDPNASVIRKVDKSTGIITTVIGDGTAGYNGDLRSAATAELNYPNALLIDKKNNMYIADGANHRIRRVNLDAGYIETIAGTGNFGYTGDGGPAISAEITQAYSMDIDTSGNIYFADYLGHRVRKITPAGYISTIAGNGILGFSGDGGAATAAKMAYPVGVACDKNGNVYFTDYNNYRIRKVSSSGVITTIAGTGTSSFGGDSVLAASSSMAPFFITSDTAGNLIYSDAVNNRICRITPSGIVNTIAGNGIAGYNGDTLLALNAKLYGPAGIRLDKAGNLYFVDAGNFRVRKLTNCFNHITASPINDTAYVSGTASFSISDVGISAYQWQVNAGSGFTDLSNGSIYSGVNTKTLHISAAILSMNNYKYRCTISNGLCIDTSTAATLFVRPTAVHEIGMHNGSVKIFPNPVRYQANFDLTLYKVADVSISLIDALGRVIVSEQYSSLITGDHHLIIPISNLQNGLYIYQLNIDGEITTGRFSVSK